MQNYNNVGGIIFRVKLSTGETFAELYDIRDAYPLLDYVLGKTPIARISVGHLLYDWAFIPSSEAVIYKRHAIWHLESKHLSDEIVIYVCFARPMTVYYSDGYWFVIPGV